MDWVKIFSSANELKNKLATGKPQLLIIGNTRLCLVLFENKILALDDRCSHNGESLSNGTVNYLGEVICPWHGYRFKLATGREVAERSNDLKTYQVKEDESGVFLWI